jgi:hypothetical protein
MPDDEKNQTPPNWQPERDDARLGTGLFLVFDRSIVQAPRILIERLLASELPVEEIVIPELTYDLCVKIGDLAYAFKWVPPEHRWRVKQGDFECVGRCDGSGECLYQPHCWCLGGRCQKRTGIA